MAALLIPMVVFTIIVALLAMAVLIVRTHLTAREHVTIAVNGRRTLDAISGDTLLNTLRDHGIELPAACGGRGACGQCRVAVQNHPGELLPTEMNHINRYDAASGVRLACMVKVRDDMDLRVPQDILDAQRCVCRVHSNHNVSTYLKSLVLELPESTTFEFEAGDYVLIEAPPGRVAFADFQIDAEYRSAWETEHLLDLAVTVTEPTVRAYSLGNPPLEKGRLMLVMRIALPPPGADIDVPPGLVSSYLFSLRAGDTVQITGPFGEFHALDSEREMIFVGGGAGIAPMRSIILDQLLGRHTKRKISFWYGSRNYRELCFFEEFNQLAAEHDNFTYHVALSGPDADSDWSGDVGLIHRVLFEKYLAGHSNPEEAEYYLCGPPLMSAATLAMLEDLGVDRESVLFDDFASK